MRTTRRTRTAAGTARTTTRTTVGAPRDRALHRSLTVAGLAGLGVPLMAASALAATASPLLPLSADATVTTSATGTTGAVADLALAPLRSTAGTLRLCPGEVTSLDVRAAAGSLTVVRPRVATTGWATGTTSGVGTSTPGLMTSVRQAEATSASASASSSGVTHSVDAPVVSYVVGSTRVALPPLSLQSALSSVRSDVRTAAGFVPAVTAAVDMKARGAAVAVDGPLSLGMAAGAGGCLDLDWQLLG